MIVLKELGEIREYAHALAGECECELENVLLQDGRLVPSEIARKVIADAVEDIERAIRVELMELAGM